MVDDEPLLCLFTTDLLEMYGYEVVTALQGEEAIEQYKQAIAAGTPFDVVITDLMFRDGIDGATIAQRILDIDPRARIIIASGWADDPVMVNYVEHGFGAALLKPYSDSELRDVLARVLARS
jgi:two-component system cell cycle sensor histidine kinase/response regulator CckA